MYTSAQKWDNTFVECEITTLHCGNITQGLRMENCSLRITMSCLPVLKNGRYYNRPQTLAVTSFCLLQSPCTALQLYAGELFHRVFSNRFRSAERLLLVRFRGCMLFLTLRPNCSFHWLDKTVPVLVLSVTPSHVCTCSHHFHFCVYGLVEEAHRLDIFHPMALDAIFVASLPCCICRTESGEWGMIFDLATPLHSPSHPTPLIPPSLMFKHTP